MTAILITPASYYSANPRPTALFRQRQQIQVKGNQHTTVEYRFQGFPQLLKNPGGAKLLDTDFFHFNKSGYFCMLFQATGKFTCRCKAYLPESLTKSIRVTGRERAQLKGRKIMHRPALLADAFQVFVVKQKRHFVL
ncbi:MAG TPA: hypothetical protein VKN35_07180, partial [Xanthomonadales bacterium]|nr:hypothetical protein [Xanthomonadales bacterium]